jgi:hypothetical protein
VIAAGFRLPWPIDYVTILPMSGQPGYFAADAEADDELARLQVQATVHDPTTFRHFETIGVTERWRCLVASIRSAAVRSSGSAIGPTFPCHRPVVSELNSPIAVELNSPIAVCGLVSDTAFAGTVERIDTRSFTLCFANRG